MSQTEPPRTSPSPSAMTLCLTAGLEYRLSKPGFSLDDIGKKPLPSQGLAMAFVTRFPAMAQGFFDLAKIDAAEFRLELSGDFPDEPEPEARKLPDNPTEEQVKLHELIVGIEADRKARGEAASMTRPCRGALREASRLAKERGEKHYTVGLIMAALFENDSNAHDIVARLADASQFPRAVDWLRDQPDPAEPVDLMSVNKENIRKMLDRTWPSLQQKSTPRQIQFEEARDRAYEENPAAYEEPLDIADRIASQSVPLEKDFAWRTGVCLHAAANEARIRRAPEVQLDHMIVALLREATDTAAFLDRQGVDRKGWTQMLDAMLPTYDEGPRWPPNGRSLGMKIPSNTGVRLKPMPEGIKWEDLPPEELKPYVEKTVDTDRRFTDIHFLLGALDEPETIAYTLMREAGIGEDPVRAEIQAWETGDPDWWRKKPDLVSQLRRVPDDHMLGGGYAKGCAIHEASQFVARMRGAAKVEPSDVFLSLLSPGTDFWTMVESLGKSPQELAEDISRTQQTSDVGIMFPDELLAAKMAYVGADGPYSDLLVVFRVLLDPREVHSNQVFHLLEAAGINVETVRTRIEELGIKVIGP